MSFGMHIWSMVYGSSGPPETSGGWAGVEWAAQWGSFSLHGRGVWVKWEGGVVGRWTTSPLLDAGLRRVDRRKTRFRLLFLPSLVATSCVPLLSLGDGSLFPLTGVVSGLHSDCDSHLYRFEVFPVDVAFDDFGSLILHTLFLAFYVIHGCRL